MTAAVDVRGIAMSEFNDDHLELCVAECCQRLKRIDTHLENLIAAVATLTSQLDANFAAIEKREQPEPSVEA